MKNFGKFFYHILCGFFLGFSIFAPGISGGVIAIVMGFYSDIINILANPFKNFKSNIIFLIPIVIGILISTVFFILLFKMLFANYKKATFLFLVGLIAGNIPIIWNDVKDFKIKKRYIFGALIAFVIALGVGLIEKGQGSMGSINTVDTPIMVVSGMLSGALSLIPGVSISVLLILTGTYNHMLDIANSLLHFDFSYAVPFALTCLGFIIMMIVSSKFIKHIFDKYNAMANWLIFGFISGSLLGILFTSIRMPNDNFNWLIGILALLVGLAISMIFVFFGDKINKAEKQDVLPQE